MNTQIFNNPEFGTIRTIVLPDGQIGFVGKDVAIALGYTNPQKAIRDHVDDEDKTVNESFTVNGTSPVFISESGLYSLILASKLPTARKFKHWVTAEVLPQIRKTGGYIPCSEVDDDKEILSKALNICMNTMKMKDEELDARMAQIARLTPDAEYAEKVLLSETCYTMTEVAKSLSMTVQELQNHLHRLNIIYRSPSGIFMLYAPYLKQGYEAYRTRMGKNFFGEVWTNSYLVWTERGKKFIHYLLAA